MVGLNISFCLESDFLGVVAIHFRVIIRLVEGFELLGCKAMGEISGDIGGLVVAKTGQTSIVISILCFQPIFDKTFHFLDTLLIGFDGCKS